jgi:hypothetical protein
MVDNNVNQPDTPFRGEDLTLQPSTQETTFSGISTKELTNEAMVANAEANNKDLVSKDVDITGIGHLLNDDKDTIIKKYTNGDIDDTQVNNIKLYRKIKNDPSGVYSLSKEETITAYENGLISDDTVSNILDYRKQLTSDTANSDGGKFISSLLRNFIPQKSMLAAGEAIIKHDYQETSPLNIALEAAKVGGKAAGDEVKPVFNTVMDVARIAGAPGSAVVGVIGHEYKALEAVDVAMEQMQTAKNIFTSELFHTWGTERPDYEGLVIDRYLPNLPDVYRLPVAMAISFATDPLILIAPFVNALRVGVAKVASKTTTSGPFRATVEALENSDILKLNKKDIVKLADEADMGNSVSAKKLVDLFNVRENTAELTTAQLKDNLGIKVNSGNGNTLTMETLDKLKTQVTQGLSEFGEEGGKLTERYLNLIDSFADGNTRSILSKAVSENKVSTFADNLVDGNKIISPEVAVKAFQTKEEANEVVKASQEVYQLTQEYEGLTRELVVRAISDTGTPAQRAIAFNHVKVLSKLAGSVEDIGSAFGKGLEQHKLAPVNTPAVNTTLGTTQRAVLVASNDQEITKVLQYINTLPTTAQVVKASNIINEHRVLKGLLEFMQTAMLSDPSTQIVNAVSGAATSAHKIIVRSLALASESAWNNLSNLFRKESKQVYAQLHIQNNMAGLMDGFTSALRIPSVSRLPNNIRGTVSSLNPLDWGTIIMSDEKAGTTYKAFIKGSPITTNVSKVEGTDTHILKDALRAAGKGLDKVLPKVKLISDPNAAENFAVDVLAPITSSPFKMLSMVDEFWKSLMYHTEVNDLIFEDAIKLGVPQTKIPQYIDMVKKSPRDFATINLKAVNEANYLTFANKLDGFAKSFENGLNNTTFGLIAKILNFPFIRTPINILDFSLQQLPGIGLAYNRQRELLAAGGSRRAEVIIKQLFATSAIGYGAYLYNQKRMTASLPKDERFANYNAGIQANSIKNDDGKWVAIDRLDPFAMLFIVGAEIAQQHAIYTNYKAYNQEHEEDFEFVKNRNNEIDKLLLASVVSFTDMVFTRAGGQNASDFIDTLRGKKIPKDLATEKINQLTPAFASFANRVSGNDDIMREVYNLSDGFFKRVDPSKLYPKRHPLFGTPLASKERMFGLLPTTEESNDAVATECLNVGANITPASNLLSKKGVSIELPGKEYDRWMELYSMSKPEETLSQIINSQFYKELPNKANKAKLITSAVSKLRLQAFNQLIKETPSIGKEVVSALRLRLESDILTEDYTPDLDIN